MPALVKSTKSTLRTKNLSELLVLDIIQRLGSVRVSQLVYALKQATKNSRAPFFIGTPLRDVLLTYQHLRQVESTSDGTDNLYSLTPNGKRAAHQWGNLVVKYYPAVEDLTRSQNIATSKMDQA